MVTAQQIQEVKSKTGGHGQWTSEELLAIIESCLKLDHLARPQTAFELQKALMKGVAEVREVEAVAVDVTDDSFSGRLKKTLNRKIF